MLHTVKKDIKKEMNKMDKKRIAEYAKIMKEMVSEITDVGDIHSNEDSPFGPKDYKNLVTDSYKILRIMRHYARLLESAEE